MMAYVVHDRRGRKEFTTLAEAVDYRPDAKVPILFMDAMGNPRILSSQEIGHELGEQTGNPAQEEHPAAIEAAKAPCPKPGQDIVKTILIISMALVIIGIAAALLYSAFQDYRGVMA